MLTLMASIQDLNSERISLLGIGRRADGIAAAVNIDRKPQIICIIVAFMCGILSITYGGIEHTIEYSKLHLAVYFELNNWTGAMVSYNYLLFHNLVTGDFSTKVSPTLLSVIIRVPFAHFLLSL